MAIDTENKRRSMLGVMSIMRILPVPDGAIDAADRAHMYIYRGIPISAGGVPPVRFTQVMRQFSRFTQRENQAARFTQLMRQTARWEQKL